MQIGLLRNLDFKNVKSNSNFLKNSTTQVKNNFEFPKGDFFSSYKVLSFGAKGDYDNLTPEEIAQARRQRRLDKKAQKQARYEYWQQKKEMEAPVCTINEANKTIDILAKAAYPANILSNYKREEIPFYVDDIPCHSIEGFLQSLKTKDEDLQKELCLKSGSSSRHLGRMLTKKDNWQESQTLYWQGVPYKRDSKEYLNLVMKAYNARFEKSEEYRKALSDTIGYTLLHSCGCDDCKQTVLTTEEFIGILNSLRDRL